MRSYFSLTKTFLAAVGMSEGQDKKRKIFILLLALFAAVFIMLPACLIVFTYVGMLTHALRETGSQTMGIELMFYIISIFSVIFGINVVFNEFYFTNDIQYLLPWPIRPSKIVGSKFTACFFVENVMQVLLVASCILGFGFTAHIGMANWFYSILGILTLPLLPMAYCSIVCILIMAFTRFIRNKDVMQRISVAVVVVLLIALVVSASTLQAMDMNNLADALVEGNKSFFHIMDCIFPNIYFFTDFFATGSISSLIWYLVVNIGAIAVMLILAELFYYKGVVGLSSGSSKKNKNSMEALVEKSKLRSPFKAYFLKEWRVLISTPTFFTHCVLSNFIWPLFVFAYIKLQPDKVTIASLREQFATCDSSIFLNCLYGCIAISLIVGAMNSLSASSFSREGKHFSFMKYIPMTYEMQWGIKWLIGIIFPLFALLVFFIPACFVLQVPIGASLLYILLTVFCVTLTSFVGICIDANQPKLIWDDELNALRENYNNFFTMAVAVGFAVILCLSANYLQKNSDLSILSSGWCVLALLLILNLIFYMISKLTITKNIQNQEET